MFKVNKSEFVELYVSVQNAAQARVNFLDQPYLRDKLIDGLETFTVTDIPVSPNGKALVSAAVMQKSYLVLYMADPDSQKDLGEYVKMPLVSMHRVENATPDPFIRVPPSFNKLYVQWLKSYIIVPAGVGGGGDVSFLFTCYYSDRANVK
jgi:hypothetical protein